MSVLRICILVVTMLIPQAALPQRRNSIRSVDFENFTYPAAAEPLVVRGGQLPETRTPDGRVTGGGALEFVTYGDATGDGAEEAIAFISIISGGSAMPGVVYVYTMHRNRPRLLWSFWTGDRADGGLRGIYADKGHLVVELNGPKRGLEADCCPRRFTRTRYVWRGGRFRQRLKRTFPVEEAS